MFSFKTLAVSWTGLAGAAVLGAGVLQASYVPPAPVRPPEPAMVRADPPPAVAPSVTPPPEARLRPAPHPVAEPLPVPPMPPMRTARAEIRHPAPAPHPTMPEPEPQPAYAMDPGYLMCGRGRLPPYPGQYVAGPAYDQRGQMLAYGW